MHRRAGRGPRLALRHLLAFHHFAVQHISTRPPLIHTHNGAGACNGVAQAVHGVTISNEQGSHFAGLALAGISREYPNKLDHVINGPADLLSPRALHPAFYGCFDWHSSVHGHWMLVRL